MSPDFGVHVFCIWVSLAEAIKLQALGLQVTGTGWTHGLNHRSLYIPGPIISE